VGAVVDTTNWFFTRATKNHARAEYLCALAGLIAALIYQRASINWLTAACLYEYIDLIGLYPGQIALRRSADGQISKLYYVLYNTCHSGITQGLVIVGLCIMFGWQWSYLAIPIHLCADRGLFNNYPKPFVFPFQPTRLPAFEILLTEFAFVAPTDTTADSWPTALVSGDRKESRLKSHSVQREPSSEK
jgi:hypothetical protein